jgi:hypothetical protein
MPKMRIKKCNARTGHKIKEDLEMNWIMEIADFVVVVSSAVATFVGFITMLF